MSFRYTNNLVGALKHRLMLESAHRDLVRRRFAGRCRGVEVVCSGYGTVLAVRLAEAAWGSFYRRSAASTGEGGNTNSVTYGDEGEKGVVGAALPLDLEKLSESIKAAVWDAIRKIRAAKEAALHRSLSHNQQLQAQAELKHWYEEDANTLRPYAFEALKHETATPWMQLVQFGKLHHAASLLGQESGSGGALPGVTDGTVARMGRGTDMQRGGEVGPYVTALNSRDIDPSAIPFGSVHPLFIPALIQFEDSTHGCVNGEMVRQEQWRELSRDEQLFWERVELIRKGQVATIKDGPKRSYPDEAAIADDNAEDKVQLRFTQ